MADKYTQKEIDALGADGRAFRNPDGHYSYPIADEEDLENAIKAVGRGGADHDDIRKFIIGRAREMGLSAKVPADWNADGSLKGASSARHPDTELLRRRRGSMIRKAERRVVPFSRGDVVVRGVADGTGGTSYLFEGYGSTFNEPFEMWDWWGERYEEVVRPGAFRRSLAARPDVPFLIGHNEAGIPLARTRSGTMTLAEDSRGLHVEARMDGRSSLVRDLAVAVERGDLDEMSIGFVTVAQQWSPDYTQRSMLDLELHRGDVSAVALAANPATAGSSMTALPVSEAAASRRPAGRHVPAQPYAERPEDDGSPAGRRAVSPDNVMPDYNPRPHLADPDAIRCGNPGCGAAGGALNSPDARFCDQCGAPLYNEDGTLVVHDSGVVTSLEGDMGTANLYSAPSAETLAAQLELARLSA